MLKAFLAVGLDMGVSINKNYVFWKLNIKWRKLNGFYTRTWKIIQDKVKDLFSGNFDEIQKVKMVKFKFVKM